MGLMMNGKEGERKGTKVQSIKVDLDQKRNTSLSEIKKKRVRCDCKYIYKYKNVEVFRLTVSTFIRNFLGEIISLKCKSECVILLFKTL